MKKILVIGLTNMMGGVETFIRNTTLYSNKNKYEYYYLIHGSDDCVFYDELKSFYDETHFTFITNFKKNPIKCFFQLKKFYKENKFDYIHLQTGMSSEILYVFPFNYLYKIKVISHSHNGNGKHKFENILFRPILNICTWKFLACSKKAEKWLFGKNKKSIIINNGIDTNRFKFDNLKRNQIRKKFNIKDEIVIGHIGRFTEQKNHEFLIDIFYEFLKDNPNSKLLLLGTGNLIDIIKKKCKDKGIIQNVIFANVVENTEDYYSAFDIFVLPSIYEGLPVVGIEAQASGLPCLFSENIDNQVLLTDGAKLVSLNASLKEWCKNIIECLQKKDDRVDKNNIVANSGYSIKSTIEALEKVYDVK